MTPALRALGQIELDWTKHLDGIWRDDPTDVPEVQQAARLQLFTHVESLFRSESPASPLGALIVGQAGSGKTHLLGALRAEVFRRGGTFVLIDVSTVRDFWGTVVTGYFGSLLRPGPDGRPQHRQWLDGLLSRYGGRLLAGIDTATLEIVPPEVLVQRTNQLLSILSRDHREEMLRHQDVLRCLFLLASRDFEIQNLGYQRLQGVALADATAGRFGLRAGAPAASDLVAGLSWLGSLVSSTVLAFDQLDSVVAENHTARDDDASEARAQLLSIGGGLMTLRDLTRRTLSVLSLVEASWQVLQQYNIAAVAGRFRDPITLPAVRSGELARKIVEARLAVAYGAVGFVPPYPSWPFHPDAFAGADHRYAREILRDCDQHVRACLARGEVVERTTFAQTIETMPPPAPAPPAAPKAGAAGLVLGRRADDGTEVTIRPEGLGAHLWVVGGSGSGASAWVRRFAEEGVRHQLTVLLVDTAGVHSDAVVADGPPSADVWFGPSARLVVVRDVSPGWLETLARELATWGGPGPIRGLLALDEARDWLAIDAVRRLLRTRSRFGVVVATADPRVVEREARPATQLWGKVSAPGALEVARDVLRAHGADGQDLPKLESGTFYLCSGDSPAVKILGARKE